MINRLEIRDMPVYKCEFKDTIAPSFDLLKPPMLAILEP